MGECSVCCEQLNNSYRSNVTCPYCQYVTCASCVSEYLCSTPEYAHCMSCKKGWDRGFLSQYISKAFVKGRYKTAREKHLIDKEMSLMPATQADVERIKYRQKQERKMYDLNKEIAVLKIERSRWWAVDVTSKKTAIQLDIDIFILQKKLELCKFKLEMNMTHGTKKTFIRKCSGESCRGFLSTQWKCGLCEKFTCKECLEVKFGDAHECKPEAVETAKLINSDSKPCPGCGAIIFKIDGCPQMWCTLCNTAFNWNTGCVVTGRIHNPHYFEYLRSKDITMREIGDAPCGGLPTRGRMIRVPEEFHDDVWGSYRLCIHIEEETMNSLRPRDTKQYRIDYLMGTITEADLRIHLQRIEKANSKKLEYRLIYTTYCEVCADLFRNVTHSSQYEQLVVEMKSLVNYVNGQFARIADAFDCKPPRIYVPGWSLTPPLVNRQPVTQAG